MKISYWLMCMMLAAMPAHAEDSPALVEKCNQERGSGNYQQAVAHAEAALKHGGAARDAWLCLGRAQGALGKHEAALAALQESAKLSSDPLQRMVVLTLLGNQYAEASQHAEARGYYEQSLALAQQEKNKRFQLININQIGASMATTGDHAAALTKYQQGFKLAANDNERADSYERIAAAHSALAQHDLAIEHQIKAVLLQERMGDLDDYANANIELGRICLQAKAYKDAEKWLGKFIPVMTLNENAYWEARARHLMGKVQAGLGNAQAAAAELAQARTLAEKIGDRDFLQQLDQETGAAAPQ